MKDETDAEILKRIEEEKLKKEEEKNKVPEEEKIEVEKENIYKSSGPKPAGDLDGEVGVSDPHDHINLMDSVLPTDPMHG